MLKKNLIITGQEQGQRLDKFLVQELQAITRSQIKKMILDQSVLINGKATSVHHFLKEGDKITISSSQHQVKDRPLKPVKTSTSKALFKKIKIVAENDNYLVINKPAGLLVHPTDQNETNTLVDWLKQEYPAIEQVGDDPNRAGIVHRLDKDVSGLMIIPLNQDWFNFLKDKFKKRKLVKKYTALVYGEIEADEGTIDFYIGRSKTKKGLFAAHPKKKDRKFDTSDKKAVTNYTVIHKYKNYTLLEVEILTGRTHQIRVHMLAHDTPIVGDRLYFKKKIKTADLDRIFLHASYLSFVGPDRKRYEYSSNLPLNLRKFLKELKPI